MMFAGSIALFSLAIQARGLEVSGKDVLEGGHCDCEVEVLCLR